MKQYRLEATPVASAKELKDQKTPKAKRIVVGTDVHLKSYQAARKIDNAAIGAVANFRSSGPRPKGAGANSLVQLQSEVLDWVYRPFAGLSPRWSGG